MPSGAPKGSKDRLTKANELARKAMQFAATGVNIKEPVRRFIIELEARKDIPPKMLYSVFALVAPWDQQVCATGIATYYWCLARFWATRNRSCAELAGLRMIEICSMGPCIIAPCTAVAVLLRVSAGDAMCVVVRVWVSLGNHSCPVQAGCHLPCALPCARTTCIRNGFMEAQVFIAQLCCEHDRPAARNLISSCRCSSAAAAQK